MNHHEVPRGTSEILHYVASRLATKVSILEDRIFPSGLIRGRTIKI